MYGYAALKNRRKIDELIDFSGDFGKVFITNVYQNVSFARDDGFDVRKPCFQRNWAGVYQNSIGEKACVCPDFFESGQKSFAEFIKTCREMDSPDMDRAL